MAPEMVIGDYYDSQVDVWSLGVLLYNIVSGHQPFPANTQNELFTKIALGKFNFEHKEFLMVTEECKDLIRKCLVRDPKKRLTATKILQHEWFTTHLEKSANHSTNLDPAVFERMKSYKSTSYFERTAMNILVKLSSEEEMRQMTEQFKVLDLDGTGLIHPHEIKKCILDHDIKLSNTEVDELIKEIDYAGNGKINYSEFLAATVDAKRFFDDSKLRVVFSMFDVEGNNKITAHEMFIAFQKLNQNVPMSEVEQLIKAHDIEKNGVISFDEFKVIFQEKSTDTPVKNADVLQS